MTRIGQIRLERLKAKALASVVIPADSNTGNNGNDQNLEEHDEDSSNKDDGSVESEDAIMSI
jgi:hypothetical protein